MYLLLLKTSNKQYTKLYKSSSIWIDMVWLKTMTTLTLHITINTALIVGKYY